MKKVIVTLFLCILALLVFVIGPIATLNQKVRTIDLKFKNSKGNPVIELGKYKVELYDEYKDPNWRSIFRIEDYNDFVSFIKSTSCFDESLCFDLTHEYLYSIDIDTGEKTYKTFYMTVGYIIKDGYLFCYEIGENIVELELVTSPYSFYIDDNNKVVNEEPYFVCDKFMAVYGETLNSTTLKPRWRYGVSFDGIKKIYEKLVDMTVEINESDKSITVYTINPKTYEINKNQKIKMTFDEKSFVSYQIVE